MVVLIRFVHNNYPAELFYRLIRIYSETGLAMFEALTKAFADDGLTMAMKSRLFGFGSDGAKSMRTDDKGLLGRLKRWVTHDKKIISFHCLAHKLQLSVSNSLRNTPTLEYIDDHIQNINSIFSRSPKRKNAILLLAETRNKKFLELKKIFDVRWSSSYLEVLKSYLEDYILLHELFEQMEGDKEFDKETRAKATCYLKTFSSIYFYATLSFLADIFTVLGKYSKIFQYKASVIVGINELVESLTSELGNLKQNDGPYMIKFETTLYCQTLTSHRICRKKEIYGDSTEVVRMYLKIPPNEYKADFATDLKGRVLSQNRLPRREARQENLLAMFCPIGDAFDGTVRTRLIDKLVAEIMGYFPKSDAEMADVLLPKKIPENANEIIGYANGIRKFATAFGYDELLATKEFADLLREILPDRCRFLNMQNKPQRYWKHILDSYQSGKEIRKIIHHILSIPSNSASAERAFSTTFFIRQKRTSSLTPARIDKKMRCVF